MTLPQPWIFLLQGEYVSVLTQVFIPLLPEITNFSMKYFILSKVYTDESGIKKLKHSLLAFTGDNPLAEACGLSLCTGGQTMV